MRRRRSAGRGWSYDCRGGSTVISPLRAGASVLYMTNSVNFTAANDSVMALAVDQSSGQVSQIGPVLLVDGSPGSLVCDPSGQFVYVVSSGEDPVTGAGFLHVSSYAISTSAATAGQ